MMRGTGFALLTFGVLSASTTQARIDVAPAPREIRPDGSRDPVPTPTAAKKENPLEVVERIIKNSKAVGEKLAKTDTGATTRGTQDTILKDIQSLIDQQDDPPPSPDQNPDQNKKNMDDTNKKNDTMPMGGMGDMSDMKDDAKNDTNKDGMQQPMGGQNQGKEEAHSRRPRQQNGGQPKENRQSKGSSGGKQQSQAKASQPPKNPKNTGGTVPDPSRGKPKDPGRPTLPLEEEIVKEVWGHLPDKLRQQATQYYQQDFMPRYSELLKLYYSSLTEKGGKK